MIGGFRPTGNVAAISETLAALERAGFTGSDRAQLRFSFAAAGVRPAVELASSLRAGSHNRVQVRPAPRQLFRTCRWNVIVTTPPALLARPVIQLWSAQMQELAESHAGCVMIGWQPVVDCGRRS